MVCLNADLLSSRLSPQTAAVKGQYGHSFCCLGTAAPGCMLFLFLPFQDSVADHLIPHTVNRYYQLVFMSLSRKLPKRGDGNAIF